MNTLKLAALLCALAASVSCRTTEEVTIPLPPTPEQPGGQTETIQVQRDKLAWIKNLTNPKREPFDPKKATWMGFTHTNLTRGHNYIFNEATGVIRKTYVTPPRATNFVTVLIVTQ